MFRYNFVFALLAVVASANAFVIQHPTTTHSTTLSKTAGTATTTTLAVKITYNGKSADFKSGSPMKNVVSKLGVPVKYSCKKGDCATCEISLAGRRTKVCVAKVPPEPTLKSLKEKGLVITG